MRINIQGNKMTEKEGEESKFEMHYVSAKFGAK